jgi:hypothetical protein
MKTWIWNDQGHDSRSYFKLMLNKGNGWFYFYLYPFEDLVHASFHGGFHMHTIKGTFLKIFLKYKWTINELQVNYKLTTN